MSDGFITWYLRGPVTTDLVDRLTDAGAALTYPGSVDEVSILDPEGSQVFLTHDVFLSLLRGNSLLRGDEPSLTFQLWWARSDDLVVTVRRHTGIGSPSGTVYSVDCSLDGLTTQQTDSVVAATGRLLDEASESVVAAVVDRRGRTADVDWDAFMNGSGDLLDLPDLLVMSQEHLEATRPGWGDWSLGDPAPALATLRGMRPLAAPFPAPDDLRAAPLWENYVVAQMTQASLGLIPLNTLALGVVVDGLDVTVTCQLGTFGDTDLDDLHEITEELATLVGGHVHVTSTHEVRDEPAITPHDAATWIYVARPEALAGSTVETRLLALASGSLDPSDAADWAARTMERLEDADVPDAVWVALDRMSGADLLAGPGTPLHGPEDYRMWLAELQAEQSR